MEEQRKLLNWKWGKRLHYDYVILTAGPNEYPGSETSFMRKEVKEILYTHEFLGFAMRKFRKHTPKSNYLTPNAHMV